ncbi:Protein FecR [compost metagenome]
MRRLDPISEAAIDWMVRLGSGAISSGERQALAAWLAADPRHRAAWEQLQGVIETPLAALRRPGQTQAAVQTLRQEPALSRRKLLGGGAAVLVLGLAGGLALQRSVPLGGLLADLHTGTGERRQLRLPDGSQLTLNARSVVDVEFGTTQRLLRLRQGELLVQVAADPARPFVVATAEGRVRALGTRFLVRQNAGDSLVAVQEHSVEVSNQAGQRTVLDSGRALRLAADGLYPLDDGGGLGVWTDGLLEVRDAPLGTVLDALRPYRRGLLRVSPEAARLRVFGVFSLDDSERTLQALAETLPIRVRRYGPWLTLVEVR